MSLCYLEDIKRECMSRNAPGIVGPLLFDEVEKEDVKHAFDNKEAVLWD